MQNRIFVLFIHNTLGCLMAIVLLITVIEGHRAHEWFWGLFSPVCASSGETAHRSFEPATGHWAASAQERRTQIPTTWLSIPRTNTCNRWESSICLSLGSRRPHAWMYPCAQFVRKVRHEFMLAVKCRRNSEETRQEMDWPYFPRPPEPLLAHYLSKLNQDRCVYFVQPFKRLIVHVSSVILKRKPKENPLI